MPQHIRSARINVRVLSVTLGVILVLGIGAYGLREVRRGTIMRDSLSKGSEAYDEGRWDEAYRQFRRYLEKDRNNEEVLDKFAEAHLNSRPLEQGDVEAAIWAYRRLMQIDSTSDKPYEVLAELYIATQNSNELAYIARRRTEQAPDDSRAYVWLATSLMAQHRSAEAREVLEQLELRLNSKHDYGADYLDACALLSALEMRSDSPNRFEYALDRLNRAVEKAPKSAYILTTRARMYREQSETAGDRREEYLDKARRDLLAAEEQAATNARDCLSLCREWLDLHEFEKADHWIKNLKLIPSEEVHRCFRDEDDWAVAVFLLEADSMMRNPDAEIDLSAAKHILEKLQYERQRVGVLPTVVRMFAAAGELELARTCLSEYASIFETRGAPGESEETEALLKAYIARAEGEPYEVIALLQPYLHRDPSDPMTLKLLADACQETGQDRLAARALHDYTGKRGRISDPDAAVRLARSYLHSWRLGEAARLAASVESYDVDAALIRIEADLLRAKQRGKEAFIAASNKALDRLSRLQGENPSHANIPMLRASIAVETKSYKEAERILLEARQGDDNDESIDAALANVYLASGQVDEALVTARGICDQHPTHPVGWLTLANVYETLKQYERASEVYAQALQSVDDEKAKRSIGLRYALFELAQGNRSEGVQRLTALAESDSSDVRVRSIMLELPETLEDEATAQRLVEGIRAVEGDDGRLYRLHQAKLWLASDQWRSKEREIRESLENLLAIDPGMQSAVLALGELHERLDRPDEAVQLYERTLAANPSAGAAADRLLALLHRQHRYSEARRILSRLRESAEIGEAVVGMTATEETDLEQAIRALEQRTTEGADDAATRMRLAWLTYERTRNVEKAFELLDGIENNQAATYAVRAAILEDAGREDELREFLDACVTRDESFEAYQLRATFLYRIGDFAAAGRDCRRLLTFEDRPEAFIQSGMFYADTGRLDEALTIWERGLKRLPDNYDLKTRVMTALLERGRAEDLPRATAMLDELTTLRPQDPQLLGIQALLVLSEDAPDAIDEAEKLLLQAIEGRPTAVEAHIKLIQLAMKRGDMETARARTEQALDINPNSPELLLAGAEIAALTGNMDGALMQARSVLDQDAENRDALNMFAQLAARSGDRAALEDGRRMLSEALKRNAPDERFYLDMSIVQAALGETDAALEVLEHAPTDSADVAAQRVNLYAARGEYDRIVELLGSRRGALEQRPDVIAAAATSLTGAADERAREHGRAALEKLLGRLPADATIRLDIASVLYQQGDASRASELYESYLAAAPGDARACNDYAWLLSEHLGEYAKALESANRGLETAEGALRLNLLDTRGVIYARLERLAEARADFEALARETPGDTPAYARALLQLARICARQDDESGAERALRLAVSVDRRLGVFAPEEQEEILRLMDANATGAR